MQECSQNVIGKLRIGLSINEAHQATGLSNGLIRSEIRQGKLRACRIGRRILVPMHSINEWLEAAAIRRGCI